MKDILNNKEIARLVGYRRTLNESPTSTLASDRSPGPVGELSASGRSNMPNRLTNNSGDNGMAEPVVGEASGPTAISPAMLDTLHGLLNKIGVDDSDIALNSVMLKPSGCVKVAKILAGKSMADDEAVEFVKEAIAKLAQKLVGEDSIQEDELNEFMDMPEDSRFTYTTDAMGDVTINDSETGTSVNLRGSDAVELIGELQMHGGTQESEQEILAKYQHVMEDPVEEDAGNGQFFAAQGVPEMMGDLMGDVHAMQDKLVKMAKAAMDGGNPQVKFAAEIFHAELARLEHTINDYTSKLGD
jgi:hypothetical protein